MCVHYHYRLCLVHTQIPSLRLLQQNFGISILLAGQEDGFLASKLLHQKSQQKKSSSKPKSGSRISLKPRRFPAAQHAVSKRRSQLPKQHVNHFSHFRRAYEHGKQTDRQTH